MQCLSQLLELTLWTLQVMKCHHQLLGRKKDKIQRDKPGQTSADFCTFSSSRQQGTWVQAGADSRRNPQIFEGRPQMSARPARFDP